MVLILPLPLSQAGTDPETSRSHGGGLSPFRHQRRHAGLVHDYRPLAAIIDYFRIWK